MPFQSKDQMRFMFANHPDIAKRWAAMGTSNLPENSGNKKENPKNKDNIKKAAIERILHKRHKRHK